MLFKPDVVTISMFNELFCAVRVAARASTAAEMIVPAVMREAMRETLQVENGAISFLFFSTVNKATTPRNDAGSVTRMVGFVALVNLWHWCMEMISGRARPGTSWCSAQLSTAFVSTVVQVLREISLMLECHPTFVRTIFGRTDG